MGEKLTRQDLERLINGIGLLSWKEMSEHAGEVLSGVANQLSSLMDEI